MRLKEIKPGMAIHCKTETEAKELLGYLHEKGCRWNNGDSLEVITRWENHSEETCYFINRGKIITYANAAFYKSCPEKYKYIRYTDLIWPELKAREMLKTIKEICHKKQCGDMCQLNREGLCILTETDFDVDYVLDVCTQWKADHEKKEPKVEWFWQGKIYQVGNDGRYTQLNEGGFYDTGCENRESAEEHMAEVFKEYCKNHEGEVVVSVEHVCRVKE